ncbi:MAG: hypothetical protein ACI9VN_002132 [Patescibacteria group bacterium]|jgi:hypothetical protein
MKKENPCYVEKAKNKIVFEYESSTVSATELVKLNGILGSNTIGDWMKKDAFPKKIMGFTVFGDMKASLP